MILKWCFWAEAVLAVTCFVESGWILHSHIPELALLPFGTGVMMTIAAATVKRRIALRGGLGGNATFQTENRCVRHP